MQIAFPRNPETKNEGTKGIIEMNGDSSAAASSSRQREVTAAEKGPFIKYLFLIFASPPLFQFMQALYFSVFCLPSIFLTPILKKSADALYGWPHSALTNSACGTPLSFHFRALKMQMQLGHTIFLGINLQALSFSVLCLLFFFLLLLHWPQRPSNQSSFDNRKSLTLEGVSCPPARQVVCQLAQLLETMKRIVMCRNESKTTQFACAFLSPIFIPRTNTHTLVYIFICIYILVLDSKGSLSTMG